MVLRRDGQVLSPAFLFFSAFGYNGMKASLLPLFSTVLYLLNLATVLLPFLFSSSISNVTALNLLTACLNNAWGLTNSFPLSDSLCPLSILPKQELTSISFPSSHVLVYSGAAFLCLYFLYITEGGIIRTSIPFHESKLFVPVFLL